MIQTIDKSLYKLFSVLDGMTGDQLLIGLGAVFIIIWCIDKYLCYWRSNKKVKKY